MYCQHQQEQMKHIQSFCDWTGFWIVSGKSGTLLSGASTLGNDLYFSANFDAMAAAIFDFFLHYDMKLIIKDGVLTVHV